MRPARGGPLMSHLYDDGAAAPRGTSKCPHMKVTTAIAARVSYAAYELLPAQTAEEKVDVFQQSEIV